MIELGQVFVQNKRNTREKGNSQFKTQNLHAWSFYGQTDKHANPDSPSNRSNGFYAEIRGICILIDTKMAIKTLLRLVL